MLVFGLVKNLCFMWAWFWVIIFELQLDLGTRGLKFDWRTNLESGPQFAKIWCTLRKNILFFYKFIFLIVLLFTGKWILNNESSKYLVTERKKVTARKTIWKQGYRERGFYPDRESYISKQSHIHGLVVVPVNWFFLFLFNCIQTVGWYIRTNTEGRKLPHG